MTIGVLGGGPWSWAASRHAALASLSRALLGGAPDVSEPTVCPIAVLVTAKPNTVHGAVRAVDRNYLGQRTP